MHGRVPHAMHECVASQFLRWRLSIAHRRFVKAHRAALEVAAGVETKVEGQITLVAMDLKGRIFFPSDPIPGQKSMIDFAVAFRREVLSYDFAQHFFDTLQQGGKPAILERTKISVVADV